MDKESYNRAVINVSRLLIQPMTIIHTLYPSGYCQQLLSIVGLSIRSWNSLGINSPNSGEYRSLADLHRYSKPEHYGIVTVPLPKIRDNDVLIKVKACGVCGTDLHIHEGEFIAKVHEVSHIEADIKLSPFFLRFNWWWITGQQQKLIPPDRSSFRLDLPFSIKKLTTTPIVPSHSRYVACHRGF